MHAHENQGTYFAFARLEKADDGEVSIARVEGEVAGVAVREENGGWHLEASEEVSARQLTARMLEQVPARRIVCSGVVAPWVCAVVQDAGLHFARRHRDIAMRCDRAPSGEAEWASPGDEERLAEYQRLYNDEHHTSMRFDRKGMIASRKVAIVRDVDRIVGVALDNGDTPSVACIGGSFVFPGHRRAGWGAHVTGFLTRKLLLRRPAVHLIVDDDNDAAIRLYGKLGFKDLGTCFIGYLP
jgi:ribosomal protein S18 acetylase RimI-like enzyme